MRFYKKEELTYRGGYLVNKDGNIMDLDCAVVTALNEIEMLNQRAQYHKAQNKIAGFEELEPFTFADEHSAPSISFDIDTPFVDRKVKESMIILKEVKALGAVKKMEEIAEGLMPALTWIHKNEFVSSEAEYQPRLNMKTVGNPLELTVDKVLTIIFAYVIAVCDVDIVNKDAEEDADG